MQKAGPNETAILSETEMDPESVGRHEPSRDYACSPRFPRILHEK